MCVAEMLFLLQLCTQFANRHFHKLLTIAVGADFPASRQAVSIFTRPTWRMRYAYKQHTVVAAALKSD